ncbi:MAG: hypothetical protein GY874_00020, partial [Desulfobacteraceae bacterium]|nr:hypothetical protein [Desulfobacteraceae bacterium]
MSKKYTAPATVSFNGQSLITTKDGDEEILVAMKPIVEAMGIQWEAQFKLIKRDAVLNSTISIMEIVGKDGKTRQMTCLPIQYLNGWLFKINAARYKDPIRRELIIKYQKECYQALHDYWHKGEAVNPRSTTHPKPKLKRPQIPPVNKN